MFKVNWKTFSFKFLVNFFYMIVISALYKSVIVSTYLHAAYPTILSFTKFKCLDFSTFLDKFAKFSNLAAMRYHYVNLRLQRVFIFLNKILCLYFVTQIF